MFTPGDLQRKYGVSRQTISNWAAAFARFLSPLANPPGGAKRRFTEDDIRVFSLVAEMKERGLNTDEIGATLAAGQRGELPEVEEFLPSAPSGAVLALQQRLIEVEQLNDQLRTERDRSAGQVDILRLQIKELMEEITRLRIEIHELKKDE